MTIFESEWFYLEKRTNCGWIEWFPFVGKMSLLVDIILMWLHWTNTYLQISHFYPNSKQCIPWTFLTVCFLTTLSLASGHSDHRCRNHPACWSTCLVTNQQSCKTQLMRLLFTNILPNKVDHLWPSSENKLIWREIQCWGWPTNQPPSNKAEL